MRLRKRKMGERGEERVEPKLEERVIE